MVALKGADGSMLTQLVTIETEMAAQVRTFYPAIFLPTYMSSIAMDLKAFYH